MKKKILSIVLCVALIAALCIGLTLGLTACDKKERVVNLPTIAKDDIKIGFIMLHDPKTSTYDRNFYDAMEEVKTELGLSDDQVIYRQPVAEGEECYNTAVELIEDGCNIIFADSFGHEDFIMQAAWEYPNVYFCHATGTKAHTAQYGNFFNAFASIYEGRYLAGVAAGLKLKEMGYGEGGSKNVNNPKVGYVGAYPYAEVISGYTSWFLGVRSIVPGATMDVTYTNSWFDVEAEGTGARSLIDGGCVLISQHADSLGAPQACEDRGVPNVSYNGSTEGAGPNTFIVSSRINWAPYFKYMIAQAEKGEALAYDWTGNIETGSVELTALGSKAFANNETAQEQLDAVKAQLVAGTLHVFATDKFTVKGQPLTTYLADVDDHGDFKGETEVVSNGYFHESEYRSAPYFDVIIDGITVLANTTQA